MTEPTPPPVPPYGAAPAPAPQPGYPGQSGYAGQPGYPAPPAYPAPPGAYAVPVGGYQAPVGGYTVPPVAPPASRMLGVFALIAALLAAIVVPILGGVFGFEIGTRVRAADLESAADDLSILSPARMQVLWAEIAFWSGTVLGVLAIVLGIIATAKRRGRGLGIFAMVLAALGPAFFFLATFVMMGVGTATSTLPTI